MPPKLRDDYLPVTETFRDRARYGAHVYFARMKDGTTALDADGEPLRFDFAECRALCTGTPIPAVIAARPETYPAAPKPAPLAEVPEPTPKKKRRGRPKKNGTAGAK